MPNEETSEVPILDLRDVAAQPLGDMHRALGLSCMEHGISMYGIMFVYDEGNEIAKVNVISALHSEGHAFVALQFLLNSLHDAVKENKQMPKLQGACEALQETFANICKLLAIDPIKDAKQ